MVLIAQVQAQRVSAAAEWCVFVKTFLPNVEEKPESFRHLEELFDS